MNRTGKDCCAADGVSDFRKAGMFRRGLLAMGDLQSALPLRQRAVCLKAGDGGGFYIWVVWMGFSCSHVGATFGAEQAGMLVNKVRNSF